MAHDAIQPQKERGTTVRKMLPNWTFTVERVTRIELALSAWESVPSGPVTCPDLRFGVPASDRERPLVTGVNGPLMARRFDHVEGRPSAFKPDIFQVGADRANVVRCCWSLPVAVAVAVAVAVNQVKGLSVLVDL
jgi:hypothetical protein